MIEEPDSMNQVGKKNIDVLISDIKTKEQLIKDINGRANELEAIFIYSLSHDIENDVFVGEIGQYQKRFQSTEFQKEFIKLACYANLNGIEKEQLTKLLQFYYELVVGIMPSLENLYEPAQKEKRMKSA